MDLAKVSSPVGFQMLQNAPFHRDLLFGASASMSLTILGNCERLLKELRAA
jgi:hypothetical protein